MILQQMKYRPPNIIRFLLFVSIPVSLLVVSCSKEENEENTKPPEFTADSLRMNEIQFIGSHNSYRLKTYAPLYEFIQTWSGVLPASLNPDELDYTHLALEQQFSDYGIRKIELDIYYDPDGSRFANRHGLGFIGESVESGIAALDEPGFKVLHIPDLDYSTNYISLKEALQTVQQWSEANPDHLPIFIMLEAKETNISAAIPGFSETLPYDVHAVNGLDDEIRDVFGTKLDGVITPDDVRGGHLTLNEAVLSDGWPLIAVSRGKVVFYITTSSSANQAYINGHPSLQGRAMFINAQPGTPEAAIVMRNNPTSDDIQNLVSQGYIIRTRTDAGTWEARNGDYSKMEAAMSSGAQILSTDYYRPDPRNDTSAAWSSYHVAFENGDVARLNPVNGPAKFVGGEFE